MKENNKGLIWLIVFLIILVLGLVGFIVYDKVLIVKSSDNVTNNENMNESDSNKGKDLTRETQILSENFGKFIVTKNGDTYFIPAEKINYFNEMVDFNILNNDVLGSKEKYILDEYVDLSGEKIEFEGYKLDLLNIKSVNSIYFGNGATEQSYVFISEEGNMSELIISYTNEQATARFIKNIDKYKNIVSIVPTSSSEGNSAILIDKDGNQIHYNGAAFEE